MDAKQRALESIEIQIKSIDETIYLLNDSRNDLLLKHHVIKHEIDQEAMGEEFPIRHSSRIFE